MKVLIDISEEDYKRGSVMAEAIRNGTSIPDDATNGDVIKIVTGKFYWEIVDEYGNHCMTDVDGNRFDIDWWNTPYKRGENNAE